MANIVPFFIRDEKITLTRLGVWMSDDVEITHEETCRLFFRSIRRDESGYFLSVGPERKDISVEDTAYFVKRIDGDCTVGFTLHISDGTIEKLASSTLEYDHGRLTCFIKSGEEKARFLRAPYNELLMYVSETPQNYYLEVEGNKIILASKLPI